MHLKNGRWEDCDSGRCIISGNPVKRSNIAALSGESKTLWIDGETANFEGGLQRSDETAKSDWGASRLLPARVQYLKEGIVGSGGLVWAANLESTRRAQRIGVHQWEDSGS